MHAREYMNEVAAIAAPSSGIDTETQTAVLQYRDSATGKVLRQFPAKTGSDAYAEQEKRSREVDVKTLHDVPVKSAAPANTVARSPAPKAVDGEAAKSAVA
jgi:hypothetical protein